MSNQVSPFPPGVQEETVGRLAVGPVTKQPVDARDFQRGVVPQDFGDAGW
jgi:hypothetical protein